MPDINLICIECKNSFYFTEKDQKFYAAQNPPFQQPKRCWHCRQKRKTNGSSATPSTPQVEPKQPPRGKNHRYSEEGDDDF
jgi:ribosomal protein L33